MADLTTWTLTTTPRDAAPEPFRTATVAEAQEHLRRLGWVPGSWGHPLYVKRDA